MYIEELLGDKAAVIEKAMEHPGLAPKRNPTIENAMKAVASEVELTVMKGVQAQVEPLLQDMYDMYTLTNGEYDELDAEQKGDYSSGLDDEVEKLLEPYEPHLSADWLGRNTIDTRLWEEHAIGKLAQSVGKEVYKQLSYGKTPAQVLSNAGIVQADVDIFFQQHIAQPPQKQESKMAEQEQSLEGVVAKIRAHVGKDFDQMAVYEDIELACDDDEILAAGAGKRLGLDDEDLPTLQMAVLEYGEDTAQAVLDMVQAEPPKVDKRVKADKPKPAKKAAEGSVSAKVLQLYKEHGGTKDTDMAAALGVSRATYNNWLNEKTAFNPDGEQYETLRNQIVADVNALLSALAELDGTEPMQVQ